MLVGFTRPSGGSVAVNPRQVTYVSDRRENGAVVHFAEDHSVAVAENFESVVSYIGAALGRSR